MSDSEALFARAFTNLAVCDPVSQRYVLLPPIPQEMTVEKEHLKEFEPMLAPIDEDENKDETSFKVICTAHYKSKLVTFVFSPVTRQWHVAASPSWSSLGVAEPSWRRLNHFSYVHGCFYWTELWKENLLVLHARTMVFSTLDFTNQPAGHTLYMSTIVDGAKGAIVEMFTVATDDSLASFYLYHTTQQQDGGSYSNDCWQLKNVMELPRPRLYSPMGAKEGFLFLRDAPGVWDDTTPKGDPVNFFSLEVKTFELHKVCTAKYYNDRVHSYFGFPPSLSKPSL
uniref:Uncharacterized protein n=1 Tax=Avena sativa TaxID=4498 RepID=A0ACD5Z7Y6_AVESA